MKIRMLRQWVPALLVCSVAMSAQAMGNGSYFGIMGGPATNSGGDMQAQVKYPNPPYTVPYTTYPYPQDGYIINSSTPFDFTNIPPVQTTLATPTSNQFGSRLFVGNQFNKYAAFEIGATFISDIKYDTKGVETCSGTKQKVRDADVVLKGILPLSYGFDLFVKGGIALAYVSTSGGLNPTLVLQAPNPLTHDQPCQTCGSNTYNNKIAPTYSIGASYDLTQSWMVDLSYNVVQVGNSISSVSMLALGLSYHFTDKYCGQFLCED